MHPALRTNVLFACRDFRVYPTEAGEYDIIEEVGQGATATVSCWPVPSGCCLGTMLAVPIAVLLSGVKPAKGSGSFGITGQRQALQSCSSENRHPYRPPYKDSARRCFWRTAPARMWM